MNAKHNAGVPIASPLEGYQFSPLLDSAPFEHYADAVWDNVRMNNISQHFVAAWLGLNLKSDLSMEDYLVLLPDSNDGVYAVGDDGQFLPDHTYWVGFADRTAKGLRFETLSPGQ